MRFVDLFAGIGGFHVALQSLGHECVFACELDPELRRLYTQNFPGGSRFTYGNIAECVSRVPAHDILCAGFPCQPFSKSGHQMGIEDKVRGTLFQHVLDVVRRREPRFVLLENVGNFERHDGGRTWDIIRRALERVGYQVRGTEHVSSGGGGLVSPHHLGYPQVRERFYVLASLDPLPSDPFPARRRNGHTSLKSIVLRRSELAPADVIETSLTPRQVLCIDAWERFVRSIPSWLELPSFPIWLDEFDARYPFEQCTPFATPFRTLSQLVPPNGNGRWLSKDDLIEHLPSYAREWATSFPRWKERFIRQNRDWFRLIRKHIPASTLTTLRTLPPSLRKLEWNCKGEERQIWDKVLQFRPSGLRVRRGDASPALVSLTTTQIPILGSERRSLTRREGLRLQGFPDGHALPVRRAAAFAALGNAVHVGVVKAIAREFPR